MSSSLTPSDGSQDALQYPGASASSFTSQQVTGALRQAVHMSGADGWCSCMQSHATLGGSLSLWQFLKWIQSRVLVHLQLS